VQFAAGFAGRPAAELMGSPGLAKLQTRQRRTVLQRGTVGSLLQVFMGPKTADQAV
jgi:hypothetical protein